MAELGVDLEPEFPKPLTDDAVEAADVVITMGCGDACPIYPGKRYEDWELEDPAGKDLETVRRIRDEIARAGPRASRASWCRPVEAGASLALRPDLGRARSPRVSRRSRSSSPAAARSSPTPSTAARSGAVGVALVFGLVIMVMVYATGHLSGAHINPAVTIAFTLTRHFPAPRGRRLRRRPARRARSLARWSSLAVWTERAGATSERRCPTRRRRQRVRL